MMTAENQSATPDWTHGILPKLLMSLVCGGKTLADSQRPTASNSDSPEECACHGGRTTRKAPKGGAGPNALLVFTSSTNKMPEARGPRSRSGPRGTRAIPDPTYILTWVHGIWTHQVCPTSTERLGTVFPAGVPWAAITSRNATPSLARP